MNSLPWTKLPLLAVFTYNDKNETIYNKFSEFSILNALEWVYWDNIDSHLSVDY